MAQLADNRYTLTQLEAAGSFGELWRGIENSTSKYVAVKLERKKTNRSSLEHEYHLYKLIGGSQGIPDVYWLGEFNQKKVMVMQLLGVDIERLRREQPTKRLCLKSVLQIGDSILNSLEYLHSFGFLHRDLKPENLMVGTGPEASNVYLVDFGLARPFHDENGEHVPPRHRNKDLEGTARYASINAHFGLKHYSRRDDLESLGYIMIYLLRSRLPWQGLTKVLVGDKKQVRNEDILQGKMSLSVATLCKGLDPAFETYMQYCRDLQYDQTPDYAHLHELMLGAATRNRIRYDGQFEWTTHMK